MSDRTDFKKGELLDAVVADPDKAFEELHLYPVNKPDYVLASDYNLDGTKGKQRKRVWLTTAGTLKDWKGNAVGMVDFYGQKIGTADYGTALNRLAELYGLSLPDSPEYEAMRQQQEKRQNALTAFSKALYSGKDEAKAVLSYLYGRGWTDEDIKAARLGYADEALVKEYIPLEERSYKDAKTGEQKPITYYGTTHRLTIPYWSGTKLYGFKFRDTNHTADSKRAKYLNTTFVPKKGYLYGLSPISTDRKDCVCVEGELDALHAIAKGVKNVVATAGGATTTDAITDAIKKGFVRFTLLLDNDEAGKKYVGESVEAIEGLGVEAYVASLPEEYKDADDYFKAGHSADDFNALIAQASPSFVWKNDRLIERYISLEEIQGYPITQKQKEDFFVGVYDILNAPTMRPENRQQYKDILRNYEAALAFSVDDIEAYADTAYYRNEERKRKEALTTYGAQINEALKVGNTDEAVRLMREASTQQSAAQRAKEWAKEFTPPTKSIDAMIGELKEGIPTGYTFKGYDKDLGQWEEEITLNVGLTFVCAPTSHGKTSFLNNIALNVAEWNRQKQNGNSVLYFSYEIDRTRLIANLLNTYTADAELSKIGKPLNAIYDHARGNGSRYFNEKMMNNGQTHYAYFLQKKAAFERLIHSGDFCISDNSHKAGELLEAIRYYVKNVRKPTAIFLDYAQLIYDEEAKGMTRTEELKKIVNALKELTKELQLPIVLAAQMKNDVVSPLDVTIDNVGESKDLAMIADTTIGLFNFSKLHSIDKKNESKLKKMLSRLVSVVWNTDDKDEEIQPIRGKMYAKIIKRRFGLSDIEQMFEWEAKTGTIATNKPEAIKPQPQEEQLPFPMGDEANSIAF